MLRSLYVTLPWENTKRNKIAVALLSALIVLLTTLFGYGLVSGQPVAHAVSGSCSEIDMIGDGNLGKTVDNSTLVKDLSQATGAPVHVYTKPNANINSAVATILNIRAANPVTQRCYVIDLGLSDAIDNNITPQEAYKRISSVRAVAGENDIVLWVSPTVRRGDPKERYVGNFQQGIDGSLGDGKNPVLVNVPWNENVRAEDFKDSSTYTPDGYKSRGDYLKGAIGSDITSIDNSGAVVKNPKNGEPVVDANKLANSALASKLFRPSTPEWLNLPHVHFPDWKNFDFSSLFPEWFCAVLEKFELRCPISPSEQERRDREDNKQHPAQKPQSSDSRSAGSEWMNDDSAFGMSNSQGFTSPEVAMKELTPRAAAYALNNKTALVDATRFLPSMRWSDISSESLIGRKGDPATNPLTVNGVHIELNIAALMSQFLMWIASFIVTIVTWLFRFMIFIFNMDIVAVITRTTDVMVAWMGRILVPYGAGAGNRTAIIVFSSVMIVGIIWSCIQMFILAPARGDNSALTTPMVPVKTLGKFILTMIVMTFVMERSMANYTVADRTADSVAAVLQTQFKKLKNTTTKHNDTIDAMPSPGGPNGHPTNDVSGDIQEVDLYHDYRHSGYHPLSFGWFLNAIFLFGKFVMGVALTIVNAITEPISKLISSPRTSASFTELVDGKNLPGRIHATTNERASNCQKYVESTREAFYYTAYAKSSGNTASRSLILMLDRLLSLATIDQYPVIFGGGSRAAQNGWCWAAENILDAPPAERAMIARGAGLYTEALGGGSLYGISKEGHAHQFYASGSPTMSGTGHAKQSMSRTVKGLIVDEDGNWNTKYVDVADSHAVLSNFMTGGGMGNDGPGQFYFSACEWVPYQIPTSTANGNATIPRGYLTEQWWGVKSAASGEGDSLSQKLLDGNDGKDATDIAKKAMKKRYDKEELLEDGAIYVIVGSSKQHRNLPSNALPVYDGEEDPWPMKFGGLSKNKFDVIVRHTPFTWVRLNHEHCQSAGVIPLSTQYTPIRHRYGLDAIISKDANSWRYGPRVLANLTFDAGIARRDDDVVSGTAQKEMDISTRYGGATGGTTLGLDDLRSAQYGSQDWKGGIATSLKSFLGVGFANKDQGDDDAAKPTSEVVKIPVDNYLVNAVGRTQSNPAQTFVHHRIERDNGYISTALAVILATVAVGYMMLVISVPVILVSLIGLAFCFIIPAKLFKLLFSSTASKIENGSRRAWGASKALLAAPVVAAGSATRGSATPGGDN